MPGSNYGASVSWRTLSGGSWTALCRRLAEMRIYYKLIKQLFFFFDRISLDREAFI